MTRPSALIVEDDPQLGRGVVQHSPAPDPDEEPPAGHGDPISGEDAERKLIDGLGASVIIEHPIDEGEDASK